MDIKDRIKMIMEHEQMTAAAFAESIGVAQATVSHTLGERNKQPSYDFIKRLCDRFSYVSADWLLTGKGSMISEENKNTNDSTEFEPVYPLFAAENQKNPPTGARVSENRKEMASGYGQIPPKEIVKQEIIYKERPPRKITEIRIFFDDNTYETFRPEK